MTIKSINEPTTSRTWMLTPRSINEPPPPIDPAALTPVLTSIAPDTAVIGGADVTMTVSGEGFGEYSVITFNGSDEPTTYVDETGVSTIVKPSTATAPGSFPVTVRNGELESAPLTFSFTEALPPAREGAAGASYADPDDLEEEIENAEEDGDFRPVHRSRPKGRR